MLATHCFDYESVLHLFTSQLLHGFNPISTHDDHIDIESEPLLMDAERRIDGLTRHGNRMYARLEFANEVRAMFDVSRKRCFRPWQLSSEALQCVATHGDSCAAYLAIRHIASRIDLDQNELGAWQIGLTMEEEIPKIKQDARDFLSGVFFSLRLTRLRAQFMVVGHFLDIGCSLCEMSGAKAPDCVYLHRDR